MFASGSQQITWDTQGNFDGSAIPAGAMPTAPTIDPALALEDGKISLKKSLGWKVQGELPQGREYHTAVWTGTEMLIWGGSEGGALNNGFIYNPVSDRWREISTTGAPAARQQHKAVWTGSKMIVWGGWSWDSFSRFNDGGIYDPASDTWTTITTDGAPTARYEHSAVWTGSKMIVWGGQTASSTVTNTGGIYDPGTNTWTSVQLTSAPTERAGHSAAWTGTEMIVWGGRNGGYNELNTGSFYNPTTNAWRAITGTGVPTARVDALSVWTGSKMIVWGGWYNGGRRTDGGILDPNSGANGTWSPVTSIGAPDIRTESTAVWTGSKMIVWGGRYATGCYNDGGLYDPVTNTWQAISGDNTPVGRSRHSAIWTGEEMIVWGGQGMSFRLASGGKYNPETDLWDNKIMGATILERTGSHNFWTGSKILIWGGTHSDNLVNSGYLGDPKTGIWTPISDTDAPCPRKYSSAVWTGAKMIIWGGWDDDYNELNDGAIYDLATDSWSLISTVGAPAARDSHNAVWTGSKMIVWGGEDYDANYLTDGGIYDPISDTWSSMSTIDAPLGRYLNTAVWTGTEMIIWGGEDYDGNYFNDGGKYNLATDSWTAVTLSGAPEAREDHSAVWTGTEMLIWGGYGDDFLSSGGRYDPASDSWEEVSTTGVPSARNEHSAVWTGTEMIIWGGYGNEGYPSAGSKYDPETDSWEALNSGGAPLGRTGNFAVWTGTEMLIWGGRNGQVVLTDIATYTPSYPASSSFNWQNLNFSPTGRYDHTAVWADGKFIVWGGYGGSGAFDNGAIYDPVSNTWIFLPATKLLSARYAHSAVWTGTEMVIWGGRNGSTRYNNGAAYNPASGTWRPLSTVNAPSARYFQTAVWTGTEMVIWGGFNGNYIGTGGKYNPATDSWSTITETDAPTARYTHSAVWTGTEMIIWGGTDSGGQADTGGRYNPGTNTWVATTTSDAPSPRYNHSAVWTGTEMLIWGGGGVWPIGQLNDGAKYNPTSNTWTDISTSSAPSVRKEHAAVWTGSKMIIWGGTADGNVGLGDGGMYDPSADSWSEVGETNSPDGRYMPRSVWTGTEMIIWGGFSFEDDHGFYPGGGRFNPTNNSWTEMFSTNAPQARYGHAAVWTGTEMLIWGGGEDNGYLGDGGRYDLTGDSWSAMSSVGAPEARENLAAVWTGTEMLIWGGSHGATNYNNGGKYNPASDTWESISTTGAPSAREYPTAVWTGTEMLIWGGNGSSGDLNDGGAYDPETDTWRPITTNNAPGARSDHSAVWTGTEMIIWGGYNGGALNTGGKYDPVADTWTTVTLSGAPEARNYHSAVWTGTEMIIWGGEGDDYSDYYNNGASYDPESDIWTAISDINTPSARGNHTAVWTGTKMIVWGGELYYGSSRMDYYSDGGFYDPATDSWDQTALSSSPTPRSYHSAVWTGADMLVFEGYGGSVELGRYLETSQLSTASMSNLKVDAGDEQTGEWGKITYEADTPANTSVIFETRGSSDNISWNSWQSLSSGGEVQTGSSRYLEIKLTLDSADGKSTPIVDGFSLEYEGVASSTSTSATTTIPLTTLTTSTTSTTIPVVPTTVSPEVTTTTVTIPSDPNDPTTTTKPGDEEATTTTTVYDPSSTTTTRSKEPNPNPNIPFGGGTSGTPTSLMGVIGAGLGEVVFYALDGVRAITSPIGTLVIRIAENTPPVIAYGFPYIIFVLLAILGFNWALQAKKEISQVQKMTKLIAAEKIVAEEKANFVMLASHYLRTPLTVIAGGVEIASLKLPRSIMQDMTQVAEDLAGRVESLLKGVEKNPQLAEIKEPEEQKERTASYLSAHLLLPILAVFGIFFFSNWLFVRVGTIDIHAINLIIQLLCFAVVAQYFLLQYRKWQLQYWNKKKNESLISKKKFLDQAKNEVISRGASELEIPVEKLKSLALAINSEKERQLLLEGVRRLEGVIEKFKTISGIESLGIPSSRIGLKETIARAVVVEKEAIESKNIRLELPQKKEAFVSANQRGLAYVIGSLLGNAVKFNKEKGRITVNWEPTTQGTALSITDTGVGIADRDQAKLFEPFSRATSALQFDKEGLGLDLYLDKIIMNSFGGSIDLKSDLGKGTTVNLTFS